MYVIKCMHRVDTKCGCDTAIKFKFTGKVGTKKWFDLQASFFHGKSCLIYFWLSTSSSQIVCVSLWMCFTPAVAFDIMWGRWRCSHRDPTVFTDTNSSLVTTVHISSFRDIRLDQANWVPARSLVNNHTVTSVSMQTQCALLGLINSRTSWSKWP